MKYEGLSNSRDAGTKHKSKDRSVKVRGRALGDLLCYAPVHMAVYQRFSLAIESTEKSRNYTFLELINDLSSLVFVYQI